jgi:hypothetical protein
LAGAAFFATFFAGTAFFATFFAGTAFFATFFAGAAFFAGPSSPAQPSSLPCCVQPSASPPRVLLVVVRE